MAYKIMVYDMTKEHNAEIYEQTVENLDLQAVIRAVNTPPPVPKRSHRKKEGTPRVEQP